MADADDQSAGTTGDGPQAIPVSAPLRSGDRRILLSLHRTRGSLTRLRGRPEVALAVLAGENVAFTARGQARVVQEQLEGSPDYAAVAIDVEHVDDHDDRSGACQRHIAESGSSR